MTTYTNDAALTGLADGAAVTTGNSGGGTNTAFSLVEGTVTASVSHPDTHTSMGYHVAATSGALCDVRLPLGAGTTGNAVRFYFYLTGTPAPTTTQEFAQLGSTGQNYIGVMNTGVVRIQLAGTGVYTGTYTLLANTLYRLEAWWTIAASGAQFHYALYLGDSGTPVDSFDTTTGNTGTSNPTMIYIGKHTSTGNWTDIYFSSIAANDAASGFIGARSNTAPVANAGTDQSVATGATVTLDGSGSTFSLPDTAVTYAWTQTGGTAVTLSSSTAQKPTFTAPGSAGTLTFSLTVTGNNSALSSSADTVSITVTASNTPPTANAGPDQTNIEPYATVTLNGSGSSDPDGTIASYAWTQTAGTTVSLSSSSAASPTFTAAATVDGDTLTFSLIVHDDDGAASSADTVNITVLPHTIFRLDAGGPTPIRVSKL